MNCLEQCLTWVYFQQRENHVCAENSCIHTTAASYVMSIIPPVLLHIHTSFSRTTIHALDFPICPHAPTVSTPPFHPPFASHQCLE